MKLPYTLLFIFVLLSVILISCSKESGREVEENNITYEAETKEIVNEIEDENENENSKENMDVEDIVVVPLPQTYKELASIEAGEHKDIFVPELEKDELLELFKDLPDISTNPTEQHLDYYYTELLKLMHQDFLGPEEAIRKLRFETIGSPELEDSRYQFKENLNVIIVLDASGSMANVANGKSRMQAAKDAITTFVEQLPSDTQVALRVYGHKGSSSRADKELSCSSSEIIYPFSKYNPKEFSSALDKVKATGYTPIELALNEAKKDLAPFDGADNTNIVYLVSDGIETCEGDPVKAAKELFDSSISPIINVIGFGVESHEESELIKIAQATEGIYENVTDQKQLQEELSKINDIADRWQSWKESSTKQIAHQVNKNALVIFGYITNEGYKVSQERTKIYLILHELYNSDLMNRESYQYLTNKNTEYHRWIQEEIDKFQIELKELSEEGYVEALKKLEEKYNQNSE